MIGRYHIEISNRYLKYEFTIQRNITVIKGNSATGKTTLIEMIREYNEQEDSGIIVRSDKPCVVLYGRDWKEKLSRISDSLVFIDESGRFSKSEEFARAIQGSDNYYVIVSRERLNNLPFSVREIYGIRESGKYHSLRSEYTLNEFYQIYGQFPEEEYVPEVVITEDTNAGYEFWSRICKEKNKICKSAGGKSGVIKKLQDKLFAGKKKLAVVDGAAFGAEMEMIMKYICYNDTKVKIYAPESFEYLILRSNIFNTEKIRNCINETYFYADSKQYFSWERYYTALLIEETKDTKKRYQKSQLNHYYLSEKNCSLIMDNVPENIKWDR